MPLLLGVGTPEALGVTTASVAEVTVSTSVSTVPLLPGASEDVVSVVSAEVEGDTSDVGAAEPVPEVDDASAPEVEEALPALCAGGTSGCFPDLGVVSRPHPCATVLKLRP